MQIKNSASHFGIVTILLHWLMAVIIISLLCVGLYMTGLPVGLQKLKLYGMHKEFGVLVIMLASLRLLWRISNITPSLNLPLLERLAARAAHWAFYVFMFAMPITGYLISCYANIPVSFFGLFTLPNLVTADHAQMKLFENVHQWLAYALIGLIIVHVLASLKHYFIDKDDIMQRMIS